jgi:predicted small secreted protein
MEPFHSCRVSFSAYGRRTMMFHKIAAVLIVGAALATAACNTVHGAAKDVNSVANCAENALDGTGNC